MGVKGLYTYINNNCLNADNGITRPLSYFEDKTVIVDVSNYMYKFKSCDGTLIELFDNLIKYLINSKIKTVLVFDGIAPIINEKHDEIKVRRKQKEINTETLSHIVDELEEIERQLKLFKETNDTHMENISALTSRKIQLSKKKEQLEKTVSFVSQTERRDLYNYINEKYSSHVDIIHELEEEADKMISRVARKARGKTIVMSDDTDMFLYGCPIVAMNYDHKKYTVDVYNLKTILTSLNINLMEFIQVCVLVGTDYLSPYHENSLLPIINISQMFSKYFKFKESVRENEKKKRASKYGFDKPQYYTNFIDFMCFIYLKYSREEQTYLNGRLWDIFENYYRT